MKIAIGILVAALLIWGGYYLYTNGMNQQQGESTLPLDNQNGSGVEFEQGGEVQGGASEGGPFITLSGSYLCTFEQEDSSSIFQGTLYSHSGMMRIEAITGTETGMYETHFLARDDFGYTWTSLVPDSGIRASLSESDQAEYSSVIDFEQINQGVMEGASYNCESWSNPDSSMFQVPESVTFVNAS